MDYEMKRITEIRPYENNPRNNEKSVEKVANSIREFGFLQPIVCDGEGVILAGHTRYEAAKRLGLETVPVIYAKDLTEGQAKAYRIADNKVGESSEWVEELLGKELEAILLEAPQIEPADFGFTSGAEIRRRKSWENAGKRCGTDLDIRIREKNGFLYTSFFTTGGEGKPIAEIKKDPEMAAQDGKTVRIHDKKLLMLEDLIEQANGHNVLVAYWFRHDHDRIMEHLSAKGYRPRDIKTDADIADWNEGKIQVGLISPASAGHGLNIQKGGHILIWFSLVWSLEMYQQTNARLWLP